MASRRRPVLLRRALESLANLTIPEHVRLSFLIVENDDSAQYGPIIADFADRMDITHVHEPRAGLVYARNRVIDAVNELAPDWVGGVDDDQVISENWLEAMVGAIRTYPDTKMFVGRWVRLRPVGMPAWYPLGGVSAREPTGKVVWTGASGNTAFHRSVIAPDGMALRYDPAFQFSGGEDSDFSRQYLNKGGKIRRVAEALTEEEVHAERSNFKALTERLTNSEFIVARIRHKHRPAIVAALLDLQTLYRGVVLGLANLLLAAFALPFAESWAMRRFAAALGFYAGIAGVWRYYFGKDRLHYRQQTGG